MLSAVIAVVVILVGVALWDLLQKRHTLLRNFPIIGHGRYWIEALGPMLRQYIVADNDEERPFSRDQRRWVYASAKKENNLSGFGTDNDLEGETGYLILKQASFPWPTPSEPPSMELTRAAKIIGAARERPKAFRPPLFYVSAMSYGALSKAAVEALNRGTHRVQGLHNTGEGGISPYHRHGGDLIWQLGTGYFGARDAAGNFSMERLVAEIERTPQVRAIEIKLSQGAKPGQGGLLPGVKVTAEIAEIRGVPQGVDCLSPSRHSAFGNADELLDFVESIAQATGLPVGLKSAVGDLSFFTELAGLMENGERGIDYLVIDGGEGGTGAAPFTFADHVSLPFKIGFSRVYRIFAERGLQDRLVFGGSGRLGFPEQALLAFALGADMVGVAREAMLSIGCIQAQLCHTGHCPVGITTHNPWRVRGLDPTDKSFRHASYMATLNQDVLALSRTLGKPHPALVQLDQMEVLEGNFNSRPALEVFNYEPGWSLPPQAEQELLLSLRP